MRTRSTKPPRGIQDRNTASVTAIPLALSKNKNNKNNAKLSLDSELHPDDLAGLQSRISQLPDIDAARIVEIHDRIVSGEYKVDSKSLAEKLRKFEVGL